MFEGFEALKRDVDGKVSALLTHFQLLLSKMRTSRASPAFIENIMVACYNENMPLKAVAQIANASASALVVTPYDRGVSSSIEKAIRQSNLGLSPLTSQGVIRVNFPPLTEDRRKELVKRLKQEGEKVLVSLRAVRREANESLKEAKKGKTISEDEAVQYEKLLQKIVEDAAKKVSNRLEAKENEIMTI